MADPFGETCTKVATKFAAEVAEAAKNIEASPVLVTLGDFKTKSWLVENNFLSEQTLYTSSVSAEGRRNKRDDEYDDNTTYVGQLLELNIAAGNNSSGAAFNTDENRYDHLGRLKTTLKIL